VQILHRQGLVDAELALQIGLVGGVDIASRGKQDIDDVAARASRQGAARYKQTPGTSCRSAGEIKKRDDIIIALLTYCLSMIFSENRFPLFRFMLCAL
jgi:hypothetical protein